MEILFEESSERVSNYLASCNRQTGNKSYRSHEVEDEAGWITRSLVGNRGAAMADNPRYESEA